MSKGSDDIRPVFNGTSCGLTDALWCPNFWLPNAKSLLRSVTFNSKFVDLDFGEMFHNFPLHPSLIPFSGVDLTPFRKDLDSLGLTSHLKGSKLLATWTRTWMGLKTIPEHCVRYYYFLEELIRGNQRETNNPMRFDKIILNIFGNEDYNPTLSNVIKWDEKFNRVAGDIKAYVDDLRAIGVSTDHAWKIARWASSRIQFVGTQDAARKRRLDHGPWAGTIFITDDNGIYKSVEQSKWDKSRAYLHECKRILESNNGLFDYKRLEIIRGFLCHLAMTFDIIFPYLKGFHLTLSSHLAGRNEDGWKLEDDEWNSYILNRLDQNQISSDEANDMLKKDSSTKTPQQVKAVPLFHKCLDSLLRFFSSETPPLVTDRSLTLYLVLNGFVDASK